MKLRECPFCGEDPKFNDYKGEIWIECKCGTDTKMENFDRKELLIKYWNTRYTPKNETIKEWEKRTDGKYPLDAPVYAKLKEGSEWGLATYDWTTIFKDDAMNIVVANHYGKPND